MKDDKLYLNHINDAIGKIESYISDGKDGFLSSTLHQDAVIRELEIIGEAVKHLSEKFRNQSTQIPWKRIAGMRDVLIHDYMGVDIYAVWEVTQTHIPELKKFLSESLS